MKKILVSFSIVAVVVAFAACKKNNPAPSNNANVMFVNGCAGTSNINVTANSAAIATNLAFSANSGYQNISAGSDNISFVLTSTGTPLVTATSTFTVNQHYSYFLGGLVNTSPSLLLTDDLTAPGSGSVKIRLVNLSHDALSITGNAGATAFATGIASISGSSFTSIPAGTYVIKVGDPSNISSVVSVPSQNYSAGKIYTVIYTGTSTGTLTSALAVTVIANN